MNRDGTAKLDFIQNIEYKFIELLSCDFMASSEEAVRQSITYRYNSVKSKVQLMEARLKDVGGTGTVLIGGGRLGDERVKEPVARS